MQKFIHLKHTCNNSSSHGVTMKRIKSVGKAKLSYNKIRRNA